MKMTRRNFISASAAAMLACGASLSAHAAENTTENGLNFITDIFKDPHPAGRDRRRNDHHSRGQRRMV